MYSILEAGRKKNTKKAKGVKKNVVKKHIRHEQYKEALFEKQTFRLAWMSCGQSVIASTGNIWTRSLSHSLTPSAGSQKMGWTRWHMDTGMRSSREVAGWIEELSNAWGPHTVVAVCLMAPQAALLEQSLVVGHRHPAGSIIWARRASQPVHFKRPHRVSGPPATTLQCTGLVKVAKADPRGDFLLFEAKRAFRDYRGGLLCQRLGLDGIRGLFVS